MASALTNNGKAFIASKINNAASNTNDTAKYASWGTGGAAAATATDTQLATEATEARITGTESIVTTTLTNDTSRVVSLHTCNATGKSVDECMRANSATIAAGNATTNVCVCRHTFTAIPIVQFDQITFTQDIKIA